jgi:Zn-dependent protease with chaperone function
MTRIPLTQISSRAWEHPADRAALNSLRAIPGFDEIVRKVAAFFGERGVRHLFTANAVRVGPTQFPELHALFTEVLETMDWPERPELFVSQTPVVNAFAVGFDKPFVVMNSGLLELLDREEQRFILAHELGHIMSGHSTYRTIAIIVMTVGLSGLPFLANIALLPFQIALLEWYRKSELSCDRAGLLGVQDVERAQRTFLKMAGGPEATDLPAFIDQAREYEIDTGVWDKVLKVMNTAFREHPFATVRVAELQRFIDSGAYAKIVAGDYVRRDDPTTPPLENDLREATDYYSDAARDMVGSVADSIAKARDAFNDAFKGRSGP